jgi:hypothetical protein
MRGIFSLRGLFGRHVRRGAAAARGSGGAQSASSSSDGELDATLRASGLTHEQLARIHSLDYLDDEETRKALEEVRGARVRWQEAVDRGDVPRLSDLKRRSDP